MQCQAGLRIAEVPSVELPRRTGDSNLNAVRDGTRVLRTIVRDHRTGLTGRLVQSIRERRAISAPFQPGLAELVWAFDGLADVVAGCGSAVLRAGRASGAGLWRVSVRWPGRWLFARMLRNPRRTRAGVSRPGAAGFSQGRRRSSASGRASRSWVWAAMISQVQRSAASGCGSSGRSSRGSA